MSRRTHHSARHRARQARPAADAPAPNLAPAEAIRPTEAATRPTEAAVVQKAALPEAIIPEAGRPQADEDPSSVAAARAAVPSPDPSRGAPARSAAAPAAFAGNGEPLGCTAPQLRRFIKSRAYVPMHELRRRFAIDGQDDDVTPVRFDSGACVYVGLPQREGRLLGELLRAGDVGYELSLDPISPIVIGLFPMRPVPRA